MEFVPCNLLWTVRLWDFVVPEPGVSKAAIVSNLGVVGQGANGD